MLYKLEGVTMWLCLAKVGVATTRPALVNDTATMEAVVNGRDKAHCNSAPQWSLSHFESARDCLS